MTIELATLGHALGGPTRLVLRPDRVVAIRMAFTPEEWAAPEHDSDEPIGELWRDGRIVADCHHSYRSLAYHAKRNGKRVWRYEGEMFDGRPVWVLVEGARP